jgi:hypothetical protein
MLLLLFCYKFKLLLKVRVKQCVFVSECVYEAYVFICYKIKSNWGFV